jgi:hypothetical protein
MNKKLKAKFKLLQHWRKLWKTQPGMMKANLDALIASRKALKDRKAKRVSQVIQRLPRAFKAIESKQLMIEALEAEGLTPTPARLKRLRVYAVRYGFLAYDPDKKAWSKLLID